MMDPVAARTVGVALAMFVLLRALCAGEDVVAGIVFHWVCCRPGPENELSGGFVYVHVVDVKTFALLEHAGDQPSVRHGTPK